MAAPPVLSQTVPPIRRKHRKLLFLGIALFIGLLAWAIFSAVKQKEPAISVQTEKVSRHTVTETVVANGKIYPVKQVHISPEVSGEITELPVKEGQYVHKGDLLLKINPDVYVAGLNQANAGYESSLAAKTTAVANLEKADADYVRNEELFKTKLLSASDFIGFKVARDVARAQLESADDQVNVAKAAVDNAQDLLNKTKIVAPMDGTITKLNSQLGERVLGTVQNAGTDIMVISDLSAIEARVDIGESDIVNLQPGEKAKLEVDSFKDTKFTGVVTAVANSSEGLNAASALGGSSSSQQSATLFEVRILFQEVANFRPGMSVTATVETRTRTNTISVPIAAVTARTLKTKNQKEGTTNSVNGGETNTVIPEGKNSDRKSVENRNKPVEIVFVVNGDQVKAVPVKLGISDDNFYEITDGLKEGDEIVTGNLNAISRTLDDGKKIKKTHGSKTENELSETNSK